MRVRMTLLAKPNNLGLDPESRELVCDLRDHRDGS